VAANRGDRLRLRLGGTPLAGCLGRALACTALPAAARHRCRSRCWASAETCARFSRPALHVTLMKRYLVGASLVRATPTEDSLDRPSVSGAGPAVIADPV